MDVESGNVTFGFTIRQFFRELFGSRLTERLEEDLLRLRSDMEQRIQDKDNLIADLRGDRAVLLAKIATYEMTIMPHASRMGSEIVAYQKPTKPNFAPVDIPQPKTRWEMVQEEHNKKIEKEIADEAAAAAKG